VRCITCSTFERREKILQPKWDTLKKHGGKRKAKINMPMKGIRKGQWYIAHNCKHLINEHRFAARVINKPVTELLQEAKGEWARKRVQMATIFYLLQQRRSMLEYESIKELFQFLETPKLALRHWNDSSGWLLASHMEQWVLLFFLAIHYIAMKDYSIETNKIVISYDL
jgi:hypothetical protein